MNVHIIKLKMKIISTTPRTHHNIKQFKDLVKDSEHSFVEIYPDNQQFTSDEMKDILSVVTLQLLRMMKLIIIH